MTKPRQAGFGKEICLVDAVGFEPTHPEGMGLQPTATLQLHRTSKLCTYYILSRCLEVKRF